MDPMRDEIQHFMSASEEILSYTVNPDQLSTLERDAVLYYLSTIALKFSNVCQNDTLEALIKLL